MIGQELRQFREGRGLSVRGAARQSGVSVGAISGWENGHRTPLPSILTTYLEALGADADTKSRLGLVVHAGSARKGGNGLIGGPVMYALRVARGLPLTGLAQLSGIPVSTLCRWEQGETVPDRERLEQVLRHLDPDGLTVGATEELDIDHLLPSSPDGPLMEYVSLPPRLLPILATGLERTVRFRAMTDDKWWAYYEELFPHLLNQFMHHGMFDQGARWSRSTQTEFPFRSNFPVLKAYTKAFEAIDPTLGTSGINRRANQIAKLSYGLEDCRWKYPGFLWEYAVYSTATGMHRLGKQEESRRLQVLFLDNANREVFPLRFHMLSGVLHQYAGKPNVALEHIDQATEIAALDRPDAARIAWIAGARLRILASMLPERELVPILQSYRQNLADSPGVRDNWQRNLRQHLRLSGQLHLWDATNA